MEQTWEGAPRLPIEAPDVPIPFVCSKLSTSMWSQVGVIATGAKVSTDTRNRLLAYVHYRDVKAVGVHGCRDTIAGSGGASI